MPRVSEIPFDSRRKRMTTVHRRPAGGARVICKGASPESLLDRAVLADEAATIARARERAGELANEGFRVLALAAADRPAIPASDDVERTLRLLGLVGIVDPPRRAAADAITSCQQAGISPVLITGDHPATARAIATELGILQPATR
jgi:P-type Ca2+ transporter type 2C